MHGEPAIFWWGFGVGLAGVLFFYLRVSMVWYSCHNLQDGGVPTLDFPIVCPIPFAMSAWLLLSYYGSYPFKGFGFVVYVSLAGAFALIFYLIELHGRPVRSAELRRLEEHIAAHESDTKG